MHKCACCVLCNDDVIHVVDIITAPFGERISDVIWQSSPSERGHVHAPASTGQTVCLGGAWRACYKMAYFHDMSSRVDFREAELACHMDGGALVSIRTPQEQQHIQRLLEELRSGSGISDGDFWIGLTRVDQEEGNPPDGVTSCPQRYRKWYLDEPSCGAESCVVMYHQPGAVPGVGGAYLYQWNDDRCAMKHNFICKYQPAGRHPEEELGTTAGGGRGTGWASTKTRDYACTYSSSSFSSIFTFSFVCEEASLDGGRQVTLTGASGTLLMYVILPTIPVLLLILLAAGTCCFHVLSGRSRIFFCKIVCAVLVARTKYRAEGLTTSGCVIVQFFFFYKICKHFNNSFFFCFVYIKEKHLSGSEYFAYPLYNASFDEYR
ncbi:chondrolectin isoform X3 [Phycodurus eques]|uniref:chondrolectin isoform X3 n=1 Tax=Phycodurus eques TaxID=693459 RepID=UPI002ACD64A7|nr:chondrolectin isoform X3 [Phycodurus eques]